MTLFIIILTGIVAISLHIASTTIMYSSNVKAKKTSVIVCGALSAVGIIGAAILLTVYNITLSSSGLMDYAVETVSSNMEFLCLVLGIIAIVAVVIGSVSVFVSQKFRPVRLAFLIAATVLLLIATRILGFLMDSKFFSLSPYVLLGGVFMTMLLFLPQFFDSLYCVKHPELTAAKKEKGTGSKHAAAEKRKKIKNGKGSK